GFLDGLPPLPAPVPGPVLKGSEEELPPFLVPVSEEFVEDLSPLPVPVPEGCEDAPSLPAVPQRLCRRSPRPRQSSQQSPHCGSPGPTAGLQIIGSYVAGLLSSYIASLLSSCVAGLLVTCPYVAGLLIAGSAGDGLRAGCLNFGSAAGTASEPAA
ncbi:hypothetical protein CRENBAI_007953, partial [Crenichthys baileyi]